MSVLDIRLLSTCKYVQVAVPTEATTRAQWTVWTHSRKKRIQGNNWAGSALGWFILYCIACTMTSMPPASPMGVSSNRSCNVAITPFKRDTYASVM